MREGTYLPYTLRNYLSIAVSMSMKLFLKMQSSNLVDVRRAETFLNSYDKAVAE